MTMATAMANGTELFFTTYGTGRPVLVMHGGLGFDHSYFRPWLDDLAGEAGAQLIFYDHRGNGRSARPDDWTGVTHETFVEDADALRAELGHERITLFGHSYGGFLAMEYALRHQDRLDGLILSCTAPALDYPEVVFANAAERGTPEQVAELEAGLGDPTSDDAELRRMLGHIMPFYFHRFDPEVTAAIDAATVYSGPAFRHAFTQCIPAYDVTGQLAGVQTPTLVIAGRHDWITPPAQGAERIHAELPNSDLLIFEESGHFPFIEEHDAFITSVAEWITSR
jgi:proline iminopeptidase